MSESGAEPIIRIEGLDKWFGHFQVLTDINQWCGAAKGS